MYGVLQRMKDCRELVSAWDLYGNIDRRFCQLRRLFWWLRGGVGEKKDL